MPEDRPYDELLADLLRPSGQVSHGLNLALRLRNPLDMPRLLLDVQARQSETHRALSELNFVHFARFLPTRDGSELLVITEFDGPLEPYVLDFAVAVGDLFTVILGYVADRPRLPVKDHPDAFMDFVRRHNRVHLLGLPLPQQLDYPLYSAYPQATVLDILGPRRRLPAPVADGVHAPIAREDVQGNILEGYRARRARHYVLQVENAARAREWFSALPVTPATRWTERPDVARNVGFTYAGLKALGVRRDWLASLPTAFVEGPHDAGRARDNGDVDDSAPEHWRLGGAGAHAMVSLYGLGKDAAFESAAREIEAAFAGGGVSLQFAHDAHALDDDREPFGFRDSIGQPRIAEDACRPRDDHQPAASAGLFLLGDYVDVFGGRSIGGMAPELVGNGTFCAVRVLEQHVDRFHQVVAEGARLTGLDADTVAAKLVGRWYDGQPLAKYPDRESRDAAPSSARCDNAFDYEPSYEHPSTFHDHDGLRCPVGAHIRRANPRSSRVAGARHTRRLLRRGMPYERRSDRGRDPERGLFGLFICASLERQFEFIQRQWLDGDIFTSGIRGTRDPIAGSGGSFLIPRPGREPVRLPVPRLTRTRGSLYLLIPGLSALRRLGARGGGPAAVETGLLADPTEPWADGDEPAAAAEAVATPAAAAGHTMAGSLPPALLRSAAEAVFPNDGALPEALPRLVAVPAAFDADAFDPTDPAFLADPYPTFRRIRDAGIGVLWVPVHRAFWVFGHEFVSALLRSDREHGDFCKQPKHDRAPRGLLTLDEPRHRAVRAQLVDAFRAATAGAATIARRRTYEALDALPGPCFDLVEHVARRIPRDVFFDILGLPDDERAAVDADARIVMLHFDRTLRPAERLVGQRAALRLSARLSGLLLRAGTWGAPGLLREVATRVRLLPGEPGDGELGIGEALMTTLQLVLAGYLSTEFLLCTGIRQLLLEDRRSWLHLRAGCAGVEQAVDEMRRFDAPLAIVDRYATRELDFGGVRLPAGARLQGLIGSANRDPAVFESPDTFDVSRQHGEGAVLTLGAGIHECLGKSLQQQVASVVVGELLQRLPDLRLVDPEVQPRWIGNAYFRSFDALKLVF